MFHQVSVSSMLKLSVSILSVFILSVSSLNLDINFLPIENYGNTTDNMKTLITNAITDGVSKNLEERGLCEHILKAMENDGKAWNCLCNVGTFWINSDAGNDGAAYFTIGGVPWLVFKGEQLIKKEELTKLENEKKTLNVQLTKEVAKSAAALKAQKAAETERDAKKKEVDECNAKIEKAKDAFGSSGGSNQAKGNAQSGGANQAKGNGPFGGKNPNAATGTVGQANKLPRGNGGKIPAAPAAAGDKEEGDENNSS